MSQQIATPDFERYQIRSRDSRRMFDRAFVVVCLSTAMISIIILGVLLLTILLQGIGQLDWSFLANGPSADPEKAGIMPALYGTLWVCVICAVFTLPIGVASAILLEEFKPRDRWLQKLHGFIQLNISNLAGVPSVVYGIIGLTTFVSFFNLLGTSKEPSFEIGVQYYDQFETLGRQAAKVPVDVDDPKTVPYDGMIAIVRGEPTKLRVLAEGERVPPRSDKEGRRLLLRHNQKSGRNASKSWYYFRIPFGRGVLAGSLTLMLVVLPIVIVSTQESLRAVPDSLREGAFGMGATRWQVVRNVTLPAAIPGVMTGSILAMSRAIGEAAPFLIIAGIVFITGPPGHLMDNFTVMPLQIYNWAQRPQPEYHNIAASGIIILLAILLSFNALAITIRQRMQRPLS